MRTAIFAIAALVAVTGCKANIEADTCAPVLPGWKTPQMKKQPEYFVRNLVRINGHVIRWNGVVVDEPTLRSYLILSASTTPLPFLLFNPQSTDCDLSVRVRDLIDQAYPCREGACGQGSPEAFEAASIDGPVA